MHATERDMHTSSIEVVGVLPCPATKSNQGAADLLETQLFAYGVGSSIAIVEVHELQLACLLQGGHRNHTVTSVKWCPDCHSRDLKSHGNHLRLASGDVAGGVVVWSLLSGGVISRLEDHFAVRDHIRTVTRGREVSGVSGSTGGASNIIGGGGGAGAGGGGGGGGGGGNGAPATSPEGAVAGLAWVMSSSAVLAVLLSPGLLLLWDTKGGAVLWKRALPAPDVWLGLQVDPWDCRTLAVSSIQGYLALLTLDDRAAERVEMRTHRVAALSNTTPAANYGGPGSGFSPHFCATRGLLLLLLPREIILYDTELCTPVASRPLPPSCAPFSALLGVYGSGVSAGAGDEGGCDCLYVGHVDGALSVFVRSPGELRYHVSYSGRLTPPAVRGSRTPLALLAVCGGLWRYGTGQLGGIGGGGGSLGGRYGSGGGVACGGSSMASGGSEAASPSGCPQAAPQAIHAATQCLRAAFLPPGQSHTHQHGHAHNSHAYSHAHSQNRQSHLGPAAVRSFAGAGSGGGGLSQTTSAMGPQSPQGQQQSRGKEASHTTAMMPPPPVSASHPTSPHLKPHSQPHYGQSHSQLQQQQQAPFPHGTSHNTSSSNNNYYDNSRNHNAAAEAPSGDAAVPAGLGTGTARQRADVAARGSRGVVKAGGAGAGRSGPVCQTGATTPSAPCVNAAGSCSAPHLLVLVALTGDGRVWRWDAPLPAFPAIEASVLAATAAISAMKVADDSRGTSSSHPHSHLPHSDVGSQVHVTIPRPIAAAPQLAGLLHTLPSAVTTFAVYPRPVAASSLRSPAAAAGAEESGGVVLLGAAGTLGGSVEVFTVQRGLVSPLSLHVSSSFQAHKDAPVRGVRWLGAGPRLVTFSSDKGPHDKNQLWNNYLIITDVRSGRSVQLPRWEYGNGPGGATGGGGGGEPSPFLGVRASPCGSYLLLLLKGASAELWGVWPGVAPTRLRLLDLPFSCVEWVQPPLPYSGQPVHPDDVTTWTMSSEPPPGPPLQQHTVMASLPMGRSSHDGSGGGAAAAGSWNLPPRSASAIGERASPPDFALPGGTAAAAPGAFGSAATAAAAAAAAMTGPVAPSSFTSLLPSFQSSSPQLSQPQSQLQSLPMPPSGLEEGQLVFTLADGRAGVLSVRGRRVTDTRVKRPMAGLLSPLEMSATAMAAVGRLVVMGDAEGKLVVWEWSTGRTTVQTTGLGLVRKIVIGPAITNSSSGYGIGGGGRPSPGASSSPPPQPQASFPSTTAPADTASFLSPLLPPPLTSTTPSPSSLHAHPSGPAADPLLPLPPQPHTSGPGGTKARVAVLFATGQCCVFDLDASNKLRPVVATAAVGVRPVLDMALLPFWCIDHCGGGGSSTAGGGGVSLMAVVTDEGSLSVLDLSLPRPPSAPHHSVPQPQPLPSTPSPGRPPLPWGGQGGRYGAPPPVSGIGGGAAAVTNADVVITHDSRTSPQHSRRVASAGGVAGSAGIAGRGWTLKAALQPHIASASSAAVDEAEAPRGLTLHLAQARSLASCLLLPRPWAMLLRLLLQLGVSQELLRYLCGSYSPGEAEEEDVRHELLALFPRAARGPLLELLADPRPVLYGQMSDELCGGSAFPAAPPRGASAGGAIGGANASAATSTTVPAIGALRIPAHGRNSTGGSGGPPVKAAGNGSDAGATNSTATASSGSGGVAASAILAISNSLSSTALALSSNMLRAVSTSLASTLTTGSGSAFSGSGAASGTATTGVNPATAGKQPVTTVGTDVLRVGTPAPAATSGDGIGGDTGGIGGSGGGTVGFRSSLGSSCAPLPLRGNLLHILRKLASMRAQGRLLHPDEWLIYSRSLARGCSPAERMAVAAQVAGDAEEARFWSHLPATLEAVRRGEAQENVSSFPSGSRVQQQQQQQKQQNATRSSALSNKTATTRSTGQASAWSSSASPASFLIGSSGRIVSPTAAATTTAPKYPSSMQPQPMAGSGPDSALVISGLTPVTCSDGAQLRSRSATGTAITTGATAAATGAVQSAATQVGGGNDGAALLWDARLVLAEAQERIKWREAHSGAVLDMGPEHQERRLLEYMVVGDLQTAVAFLLASSPENSARYYRDALCTLALAAAATASATAASTTAPSTCVGPGSDATAILRGPFNSGGVHGNVCMLLAQSAKVISAHAASIGDVLLGVPLHLAAGLYAEAALVLQENGMWRLAAVMAAHSLRGAERAQTLQRWALHVWRQEGSVWRGAGLLIVAGCLQEGLRMLLDAGLPDCAAAFVAACKHAGLEHALAPGVLQAPPGSVSASEGDVGQGGADDWALPTRMPASAFTSSAALAAGAAAAAGGDGGGGGGGGGSAFDAMSSFSDGGLTPFESLGSASGGLGLATGLRRLTGENDSVSASASGGPVAAAAASNQPVSGLGLSSADLTRTSAEFERFVSDLLTTLL